MKNAIFEIIARVIDGHYLLHLVDEDGLCIVEPHLLFESGRGDILLHCWQRAGETGRTPSPHWCNLHLADLVSAQISPERFTPSRSGYYPRSPQFHRVLFEIRGRVAHAGHASTAESRVRPGRAPPKRTRCPAHVSASAASVPNARAGSQRYRAERPR